ncbi:MAG: DUF4157 domain-containing protein [Candidatus Competibacteraceae bacterium]
MNALQRQAKTATTSSPIPISSGILQRKCACGNHTVSGEECDECRKEKLTLQRFSSSRSGEEEQVGEVPPIVHEVLRSPGQPLDARTRAFMEPRFGHDFSRVRVHTDAKAAESARAVNARAYTVGRDVVFEMGQHSPATTAGKKLLAHELTHVVQQVFGTDSRTIHNVSHPVTFESEADAISVMVVSGPPQTYRTTPSNRTWLARKASDESSYLPGLRIEAGRAEPEFGRLIDKVRYYVDSQNVTTALPYVFRVLNGLSMTQMLQTLTALNDNQCKKLFDNLQYAFDLNEPRIEVALMALMARRRKINFDCCLLNNFSKANPGQEDIITKYLSEGKATLLPIGTIHEISDAGMEFITAGENLIDHLYPDSAGHCTIGIGHLVHRGRCTAADQKKWGKRITRDYALNLFREDLQPRVKDVNRLVRVNITQPQFDALVSFQFNTNGLGGSSVLQELNQCNHKKVPDKLRLFTKARNKAGDFVEQPGLPKRRAKEGALFLSEPLCE